MLETMYTDVIFQQGKLTQQKNFKCILLDTAIPPKRNLY